ncbi:D-alanyl-D-alanine carboxypeptidase/D-alanyl-D-alanine-endopeptidase [Bacillus sp. BRMEA1]|uniref:D-alanyl-D-alanine carboxypeptidase/D-alanyl-D-alanine endopeptidase n=1 Tax=Neobacillus endophyticus TaxID=2738405 RepID=UPI0015656CAE|nr:D-alanyl-D-alanine carboxypeptidase/D-alanyl-D-alanine-endopeptidase [Neobacillus endophyticus]NRD80228.1 D-alanyl-D-alanine carboxypeptidase/D-alanyl-D-alanine-endopeptidase [Neobacillus endophyticus]
MGLLSKLKFLILLLFLIGVTPLTFTERSTVYAYKRYDVLAQKIHQIITNSQELKGAIAGISIRSTDGKIIYEHQGDTRLRPASNMKLLTAAAALDVLGKTYTFPTEIFADGPIKKKTLQGNLYVKGKGDPTLLKSDFDRMASELKDMGIRSIKGDLIGDDTWYDKIRYPKDLPWSDETTYYGAQISALTVSPTEDYDAGSIMIEVKPGSKNGDKPSVYITPKTNFVKLINHAITIEDKGKKNISIEREHAANTIEIKGTIPLKGKTIREWVGVWNPTRYAMSLLKQSLIEQGIRISGEIKTGVVPDTANMLYSHKSMPLSELVIPFMKLSNNIHAEILIKEMGKVLKGEGSWDKGLEVLETEMAKFGLDTQTLVIRDGSGVSHVDLIPANQLTQLLATVRKENWFPIYFHSLPLAGEANKMIGGTLRNRMKSPEIKGKIRAKTGTISTVTSLSGYVTTKSGEQLVFSILLNNLLDEDRGKTIEERLVSIIANQ